MDKKRIGYVIELWLKNRSWVFAYSDSLCGAAVFSTREKARESKRLFHGLTKEKIWQVALDCGGNPATIIKKVR